MSDTNRSQLAYIAEVTWGTTPGTPSMAEMRFTGEGLTKTINNILSQEIRADRQVTDLIGVSKETAGPVNFELSYGNYDDFLKAALWASDWSSALSISSSVISAAQSDNSYNRASGSFVSDGVVAGQWIKVAGFTGNAANNGYSRVVSVVALKIVVSGITLVDDSAGETVTITGSYIRNGTTHHKFTIEKGFLDIAQYIAFTGNTVNTFNLNVETQQIVTGSLGFMGKDATISSSPLDASLTAASSTEVLNAIGNIGSIREAGASVASPNFIRSLAFNIANNIRTQYAVGSDSPIGLGVGKLDLTGTISSYFGDATLYNKFLNGTRTSIDFRISDAAGNTYIIDIPEIEYDSAALVVQGQDQDVYANLNFRAVRDATLGFMIQIARFPAS